MAKLKTAYFDTKPIPASIDPEGGCSLQLKDRPIIEDEDVYEEVKQEYSLPISAKLIGFITGCVLTGMTKKVATDCNPRRIGNLLKFTPTLRGKVPSIYSPYDPLTCASAITVSSLSGLEKAVDMTRVSFVNSRDPGNKVTVERVNYVGSQVSGVIKKNKQILAVGVNMQYLTGDTVAVTYTNAAGTPVTVTIVPVESDISHMLFNWPSELSAVAAGSEVVISFLTRGGIEESEPQPNSKTVLVIDDDTPPPALPTVTNAQTPGKPANTVVFGDETPWSITGAGFQAGDRVTIELYNPDTGALWDSGDLTDKGKVTSLTATQIDLDGIRSDGRRPDGDWINQYPRSKIVIVRGTSRVEYPVTFTGS